MNTTQVGTYVSHLVKVSSYNSVIYIGLRGFSQSPDSGCIGTTKRYARNTHSMRGSNKTSRVCMYYICVRMR